MGRDDALLKLYQQLIQKRNELRLAVEEDMHLAEISDSVGDEVDAAADGTQSELNSQLAALESRDLVHIEQAISRLKSGNYGSCEECGERINVARLKALPFTVLCIKCQRIEEADDDDLRSFRDNWAQAVDYEGKQSDREINLNDFQFETEM